MDREAILEALKQWADYKHHNQLLISGHELREEIDRLEERYE